MTVTVGDELDVDVFVDDPACPWGQRWVAARCRVVAVTAATEDMCEQVTLEVVDVPSVRRTSVTLWQPGGLIRRQVLPDGTIRRTW